MKCGSSRLSGGVHFADSVEEGNRIGNEIGKIAANFVRKHINPQNPQGPLWSGLEGNLWEDDKLGQELLN